MRHHVEPKADNLTDAALLEGAATKLRSLSLDLEAASKKGRTTYAEDAFAEAFSLIDEAVSALASAAEKATENAITDEADDLADFLYEQRRDD